MISNVSVTSPEELPITKTSATQIASAKQTQNHAVTTIGSSAGTAVPEDTRYTGPGEGGSGGTGSTGTGSSGGGSSSSTTTGDNGRRYTQPVAFNPNEVGITGPPSGRGDLRFTEPIAASTPSNRNDSATGPIGTYNPKKGGGQGGQTVDPIEEALLNALSGGGAGGSSGAPVGYNYVPLSTPTNATSSNTLWVILLILAAVGAGGWYLYHKYIAKDEGGSSKGVHKIQIGKGEND